MATPVPDQITDQEVFEMRFSSGSIEIMVEVELRLNSAACKSFQGLGKNSIATTPCCSASQRFANDLGKFLCLGLDFILTLALDHHARQRFSA